MEGGRRGNGLFCDGGRAREVVDWNRRPARRDSVGRAVLRATFRKEREKESQGEGNEGGGGSRGAYV